MGERMTRIIRIKDKFRLTFVMDWNWLGFWWRTKRNYWIGKEFAFWFLKKNAIAILTWGSEGKPKKMVFGFIWNSALKDFYSDELINPPRWDLCLFGFWIRGPKMLNPVAFTELRDWWRVREIRDQTYQNPA